MIVRHMGLSLVLVGSLAISACAVDSDTGRRTGTGAAAGAAAGATVGLFSGVFLHQVALGAAAGAAGGFVIDQIQKRSGE